MISVVIPCYNETDVLRLTYRTLVEEAKSWGDALEIVFVDDGSQDDTWSIIESLSASDPRVRGLRLSRNFGHQAALGAGLEHASGDVVVVLDADLQDPPSLVNEMLDRWREGYDVVYAQRNCRQGESVFKKVAGYVFYRVLDRLSTIPRDTGDFALLDRQVVQTLLGFRERHLFWRGLRSWSGYRQTAVRFNRPARAAGETKYTLRKLIRLASNGLLSFSDVPLRLPLYAGLVAMGFTALFGAWSMIVWTLGTLLFGPLAKQWALEASTLALYFLGSVQLLSLGVIGEYLNRIHDEVRNRPRWIVADRIGGEAQTTARPRMPTRKAG